MAKILEQSVSIVRHLFLDTNILIDFLTDRKPFSDQAATLFQLAINSKAKLYVAAISFNNVYYIIRQAHSHKKAMELVKTLETLVQIIAVVSSIIKRSIVSEFKDFEDAIQSFAAESVSDVEALITRNLKNFNKSSLPVFAPEMAIKLLL